MPDKDGGFDGRYHVTDEILDRAMRKDSRACAIALAIEAARPGLKNVSVDLATIRYTDPKSGKRYIHLTPGIAVHTLTAQDRGVPRKRWKPFYFRLPKTAAYVHEARRTNARKDRGRRLTKASRTTVEAKGGTIPREALSNAPTHKRKLSPVLEDDVPSNDRAYYMARKRQYGLRALVR